jgi:hypothetical protein
MNLLKISTQFYPYTLNELKKDYPNVSFPKDLTGLDLSDYDVAEVIIDPTPEYDRSIEVVRPLQPELIEGEWRIGWQTIPLTQEQIKARQPPNWDGFNAGMLTNTEFNQFTGVVMQLAPSVALALPTALAQVSTNGLQSFTLVFNVFCQIGQVSVEQRETWAQLAEDHNLPVDFIESIRTPTV